MIEIDCRAPSTGPMNFLWLRNNSNGAGAGAGASEDRYRAGNRRRIRARMNSREEFNLTKSQNVELTKFPARCAAAAAAAVCRYARESTRIRSSYRTFEARDLSPALVSGISLRDASAVLRVTLIWERGDEKHRGMKIGTALRA